MNATSAGRATSGALPDSVVVRKGRPFDLAKIFIIVPAAFLFFGILNSGISYTFLSGLLVITVLMFAVVDRTSLVIGWFAIAPYFHLITHHDRLMPPAYISFVLFTPLIFVLMWASSRHRGRMLGLKEHSWYYLFLVFIVLSIVFIGHTGLDGFKQFFYINTLPFLFFLAWLDAKLDERFFNWMTILSLFHLVVLALICSRELATGKSLFTETLAWQDTGNFAQGRAAGPFLSTIILGVFVQFAFTFQMVAFVRKRSTIIFFWLSAILTIYVSFVTFTRSVWLGSSAAVIFFVMKYQNRRIYKYLLILAILVGLGLATMYLLSNPDLEDRLFADTGMIRLIIAYSSVLMIFDHPLIGSGYLTFDDKIGNYGVPVSTSGASGFTTSHVTLLTFAAELGIVGTFFLLAFLTKALREYKIRDSVTKTQRAVRAAFYSFVLAFIVNAFLIDMRFFPMSYCLLFASLAIVLKSDSSSMELLS